MDESRLTLLEERVESQGVILEEVRESTKKIESALLGSYNDQVGLIEQTRENKREITSLKTQMDSNNTQINELIEFKSGIKKLAAGIALCVPILFKLLEWIGGLIVKGWSGDH